jgi:hypothetical protein
MNKYEYLEEEALRLSKKARQNIPQSEERFYRAIYKIKEVLFKSGMMYKRMEAISNDKNT